MDKSSPQPLTELRKNSVNRGNSESERPSRTDISVAWYWKSKKMDCGPWIKAFQWDGPLRRMLATLGFLDPHAEPRKRPHPASQRRLQGAPEHEIIIPPTICVEKHRGKSLPQNLPPLSHGLGCLSSTLSYIISRAALPGKSFGSSPSTVLC
jgi:hypothetical protein